MASKTETYFLNLFRLTEHFGPKKGSAEQDLKKSIRGSVFYLKKSSIWACLCLTLKIEKEVVCFYWRHCSLPPRTIQSTYVQATGFNIGSRLIFRMKMTAYLGIW